MINRILRWPGSVFALVFVWKILLLLTATQPIPANDSFFYDGPVVNYLLHGKYVNPPLLFALPTAATKVFSAYPPLYELVLLPWMAAMGTSAVSAISLHLVLFGLYLIVLLAIFRSLKLPTWCFHLAGLFLFQFTFHDRPDSVAHVLGILALYCWIRWRSLGEVNDRTHANNPWLWGMALFSVLTFCTSLQIGAAYLMLIWIALIAGQRFGNDPLPILAMILTVLGPAMLVILVKFGFPELWAGFIEHARQTPSLTGFRVPQIGDVLKIVRTTPGALAAAVLLPWVLARMTRDERGATAHLWLVTLCCSLVVIAVAVGCLLVVTPNMIAIAGYFQPLIVGTFLAAAGSHLNRVPSARKRIRPLLWLFPALALLSSVRAIGMSTWGIACASDFGYGATMERIRQESATTAPGQIIIASASYLYEGVRHDKLQWIHSDWLVPAQREETKAEVQALEQIKPAKLILTQFDYFRRYEPLLAELKNHQGVGLDITNTAKIRAPDSIPSMQKVIQHISWAPVIVNLKWK